MKSICLKFSKIFNGRTSSGNPIDILRFWHEPKRESNCFSCFEKINVSLDKYQGKTRSMKILLKLNQKKVVNQHILRLNYHINKEYLTNFGVKLQFRKIFLKFKQINM